MPNPIPVNVGVNPAQLWSGRSAPGINTLLLMNTDQQNTVMVGTSLNSLVVPIQPNGSLSVDPGENWYVVGLVAGIAPLVVVPNGQSNFLGISQGYGNIAIPQFQSPNYDPSTGQGWALFKDGTATFNQVTIVISSSGVAVLIYFPSPGPGNLIGSWAASDTTDMFGNDIPQGINVNGGLIAAVTLNQPSIVGGTIFQTLLNAVNIANSNLTGGTSLEQIITFDTGGGVCVGYTSTTTTVTKTANGTYTQTLPAGVTTLINPQVWAAGAGGDGGTTSEGGNGGGAGEFAGETLYTPSTNPFTYVVGNGGNNSTTGAGHGGDGGDSFIDNGGINANGGNGDGTPGTGSTNSIHHDGGSGGASNGNSGGASGGNSGNPTATGNSGLSPTGASGAASPSAQTNSGTGGSGGNNAGNGNNGGSPGAGGGGAGQGSGTPATLTKTYEALYTGSYYGPDATITGNRNKLRSTGVCYQGGETASGGAANGNQRSVFVFDTATIASDFAGFTPTGIVLKLTNQHSWFNSGMTIEFDEGGILYPTGGPPSTWLGSQNQIATGTIGEGDTHSYQLGAAVAGDLVAQRTNFLGIGAFVAANNPYNLNYYGYFTGGHGTGLEITITGTKTVAGSTTSGAGSDGKISFQFQTSTVMVFALSAIANTDPSGNAYAAGYTGPVNVFQPGSNPAVVETWHDLGTPTGAGTFTKIVARYKLMPGNAVRVEVIGSFSAAGTASFPAIPSAYFPANTLNFPSIAANVANRAQLNNSGVVSIIVPSATSVAFSQDIPLD